MSKHSTHFSLKRSGKCATRALLLLVQTMLLVSCGSEANVRHRVHYSLLNESVELPKKMVLLQINIPVIQVRKGPIIDQLEVRSKIINKLVLRKLTLYAKQQKKFRLVNLPVFTKPQTVRIRRHLALYDLVSRNAVNYTSGKRLIDWRSKLKHFDYSIGNGLRFIARKTGAKAALFVTGEERLVDPAVTGISSKTYIIMGVVDLNSGALLWVDYILNPQRDFNRYDNISYLIDNMLANYPGLLSYRRTINK